MPSGRPNRQARRWHDVVVTERAPLKGVHKGVAACRWHASSDRPSRQARQRMLPPLELNYIIVSPSHAGKLSSYAWWVHGRGVSERQWRSAANRSQLPLRSALNGRHRRPAPEPAGETRGWAYLGPRHRVFLVPPRRNRTIGNVRRRAPWESLVVILFPSRKPFFSLYARKEMIR